MKTGRRQGLPRVSGGEPWPVLDAASASGITHPRMLASAGAAVESGDPGGHDAPQSVGSEARADGERIRRGLPRAAGGDPWPPPSAHRVRTVASILVEAVAEPLSGKEPEAAAVACTPEAPTPKPLRGRMLAAPRTRMIGALLSTVALVLLGLMAVFAVRWFLSTPVGLDFLGRFPGEYDLPKGSQPGFPAWVQWQHFFNVFLMVLIIRSGLRVRAEQRPTVFWTPRWGNGAKISLAAWFHQSLDILWLLNGVVFVVLLFLSGHWVRIVPTSWEVLPNALSAGLQYVSLNWPTEHGWVNYNSLQQLAYFVTVFVAAPLAAVTGVRMSGMWPKDAFRLNRRYPVEWARALHFPIMLYFVAFIVFHVALVFATGALRNLNHIYGGSDELNWLGFWIFAGSTVLIVGGWVAARPIVLAPIASLSGRVTRR